MLNLHPFPMNGTNEITPRYKIMYVLHHLKFSDRSYKSTNLQILRGIFAGTTGDSAMWMQPIDKGVGRTSPCKGYRFENTDPDKVEHIRIAPNSDRLT